MTQGVSSYFDLSGDNGFSARVFYSEQYDSSTGKRVVSITGISFQSTIYGGTWYPGGTVKVDGETVLTMDYNDPATHLVTISSAGDTWWSSGGMYETDDFPYSSGEISSEDDGTKSVTITVDITLYRNSSSVKATVSGSATIQLTTVPLSCAYIGSGSAHVAYEAYIGNGTSFDVYDLYVGNGTGWDIQN